MTLTSKLDALCAANANPYSENHGFSECVDSDESTKKEHSEWSAQDTGISRCEYSLALRLSSELADLRAANANPYSENHGFSECVDSDESTKKEHSEWSALFLVTRTGIEPMFQP